jgi:hypothetical protein
MHLWKARIETDAKSKYLGIVEALEADIYSGLIDDHRAWQLCSTACRKQTYFPYL